MLWCIYMIKENKLLLHITPWMSLRHNAEQMEEHSYTFGSSEKKCQNGIRCAKDILGGKPMKNKGTGRRKRHGKPSDHTAGLKPVKGKEEERIQ